MSTATTTPVNNTTTFSSNKEKEDAYGKVKVFKATKFEQLIHIDEVLAAIQLYLFYRPPPLNKFQYIRDHFDLSLVKFIDTMVMSNDVVHVSSLLLRMLPGPVVVDAQVLSQTLRALDCIEDEPTFYGNNIQAKIQDMKSFKDNALRNPKWYMNNIGESITERQLMKEFPKIHALYKQLRIESQLVIQDVTDIMAQGMIQFLQKDLSQGTITIKEYNEYCYAISGSVGVGLSRIWAASGLESKSLAKEIHLSRQMGIFAIKSAMIFTFKEDYVDQRIKWPQEIWKQYSQDDTIEYFFHQQDPIVCIKSLQCLNAIICDAIEMIPDALQYLQQLQCYENFHWVATIIIATTAQLEHCFANSNIFHGNVIIRPGKICKLILKTNNLSQVHETLHTQAQSILHKLEQLASTNPQAYKVDDADGYARIVKACQTICHITEDGAAVECRLRKNRAMVTCMFLGLAGWVYSTGGGVVVEQVEVILSFFGYNYDGFTKENGNTWLASTLVIIASMMYLFGPWTNPSNLKKSGLA